MNWKIFRVAALVGVAAVILLLVLLRSASHKLLLKAYFPDAMGLRVGAPVRLAGIDIGSVGSVRPRLELKGPPVEVVMALKPSYELNVPNDSTVVLATAGVLGETFVSIDATNASGPPAIAGAVLKTKPTVELTTEQMIEKLGELMKKKDCDCECPKRSSNAEKLLLKSPPAKDHVIHP